MKEIIFYRESLIQSVIADVVSFVFIFGGFLLNHFVLGDHLYIGIFLIFLFFIISLTKLDKKSTIFHSYKELQDYLDKQQKGIK